MEIQGPNFGIYDPRHLQVSDRLRAQSVKPNVFKDMDDDVSKALDLTKDLVSLSPEAQEFLRVLKKHGKNSDQVKKYLVSKDMKKLIYSFKELRDLVYGDKDEEEEEQDASQPGKNKQKKQEAVPNQMVYQLSTKPRESGGSGYQWTAAGDIVEKMIVHCPSDESKRVLVKELEVLGENIVSAVKAFGVHIIVLPPNQNLTQVKIRGMSVVSPGERTFDGRPWEAVRGLYDNSRRLIVIGQENIGYKAQCVSRHEFAHAFDHMFSEKNGRKLPLSVQLWNLFNKEREGLVSEYAGTNPAEYFAESVEAFFRASGREDLEQKDPKMFQYLGQLFAGSA